MSKVRDKIDLIYICAMQRSGSTLLGRLLEQHKDVFFAGEVENIWGRGFLENHLCSCGESFNECRFWSEVTADFLAKHPDFDLEKTIETHRRLRRVRSLPSLLLSKQWGLQIRGLQPFLKILLSLYESIRDVSGTAYIVDSSKRIPVAYLLSMLPGSRVNVVHLVRDVRGVANSLLKIKRLPNLADQVEFMQTQSPFSSSLMWVVLNALCEYLGKGFDSYRLIRYEDMVTDVGSLLAEVSNDLGLKPSEGMTYSNGGMVNLKSGHIVAGNPQRFSSGNVELKLDDAWVRNLRPSNKLLTSLISLPVLKRYGYSFSGADE